MAIASMDTHRGALFGLCYRMTGSAADAEDLVQETFRKALERPPVDLERDLRPWLLRVATNLCIDSLRRRQRDKYFGPWLPEPIDTERVVASLEPGPEARYDLVESATSAFLVALEALDPKQRAVVVLRDVLGLTGPEAAAALDTSAGNVRVILHRARKALADYDATRQPITAELRDRTAKMLREMLARMAVGDLDGVAKILTEDVTSVHDAGGEFLSALRVHRGVEDVLGLYRNILPEHEWPTRIEERELNGLPAVLISHGPRSDPRVARHFVIWVELGRDGRIAGLRSVLASAKLGAVSLPT